MPYTLGTLTSEDLPLGLHGAKQGFHRQVFVAVNGERPDQPIRVKMVARKWGLTTKDEMYWTLDVNSQRLSVQAFPNKGRVTGAKWVYCPWTGVDGHFEGMSSAFPGNIRIIGAVVALWDADGESDEEKDGEKPMKRRKGDRGRRRTEAWEKGKRNWRQRRALVRKETAFEPVAKEKKKVLSSTLSQTRSLSLQSTSPGKKRSRTPQKAWTANIVTQPTKQPRPTCEAQTLPSHFSSKLTNHPKRLSTQMWGSDFYNRRGPRRCFKTSPPWLASA